MTNDDTQQHVGSQPPVARTKEDRSARFAVTVFPVIIIAAFLIGFLFPSQTAPLANFTNVALGIIMFAMGITLTIPDFALVVKRPLPVLLGVVAQYVIMPAIAVALVVLFQLPAELAVGVILVGCAPGGTSSNVITYLSKGDVALSVTMTSVSTLLAPIFTPLLTLWLAGTLLPVEASAMAMSIVQMVLIPIVAGLLVRWLLQTWIDKILPALPWVSVLGISYVVVAVVSGSADQIVEAGMLVLAVVILHNALGYFLGYFASRIFKYPERVARTTSVEVGMQNSGLAATLAAAHFSPVAALPAAVFSVWHNISGGLLAVFYRYRSARQQQRELAADGELDSVGG